MSLRIALKKTLRGKRKRGLEKVGKEKEEDSRKDARDSLSQGGDLLEKGRRMKKGAS